MASPVLDAEVRSKRQAAIRQAAETLRRGGLVVFPTETVYGVGASVATERGVARLRELKQRTDNLPFTVHLPSPQAAGMYVDLDHQPLLARLIRKTMPGPITIFTTASEAVIADRLRRLDLPAEAAGRLYHDGEIGLRCPDHPAALELLAATGQPVVASSANRPGDPAPTTVEQARAVAAEVEAILDGGPCRYAKPSTLVRVNGRSLEILREGSYDRRYLEKLMQQTIVFVCSGNTCRSPMAEAIARHELASRLGVAPDKLESAGVRVLSAGAFAMPGAPMTPEAEQALTKLKVPVIDHCARPLTAELIHQADAVFCMTESHLQAAHALAPGAAGKIHLLDPDGSIDDPIGGSLDVYVDCAGRMRDLIRQRLDEMGLTAGGADRR